MGMRVIVSPSDVTPVDIAHPLLFQPRPGVAALAASRAAEAEEATRRRPRRDRRRRSIARGHAGEGAGSRGRKSKRRPRRTGCRGGQLLVSSISTDAREQAEETKAQAIARIAELQLQWDVANVDLQLRLDAAAAARDAAAAAETARTAAAEAARQAARELQPVSVLVSRKTQRLYVRQAFKPILESPVTIADPDRPIGTHVFTATERTADDANLRWNVASMVGECPPWRVEPKQAASAAATSSRRRRTPTAPRPRSTAS